MVSFPRCSLVLIVCLEMVLAGLLGCSAPNAEEAAVTPEAAWMLGPFQKADRLNPILTPQASTTFRDPLHGQTVAWEAKDVFNPAAVVRHDTLYLLYRAEDSVGQYLGTSRIGLAHSTDGLHFERQPEPVLFPDDDELQIYEGEGGCEDPRVVEDDSGRYVMTYTAYDGQTARLCVATSPDLRHWQKQGLAFSEEPYRDLWSKSGAIVCQQEGNRLIARKINDRYWMYWGDTHMFVATSLDLINWTPVTDDADSLVTAFGPRPRMFDSRLVEPGPPALLTEAGIVLLYNGMNLDEGGDPDLPSGTYTSGQALLDARDPTRLISRTQNFFLQPDQPYELTGQVGNVVFIEGLAPLGDEWFLYYGTADSKIAVAVASQ